MLGLILSPVAASVEMTPELQERSRGFLSGQFNKQENVFMHKQAEDDTITRLNETGQSDPTDDEIPPIILTDYPESDGWDIPVCRVSFNVTQESCNQRIAASGSPRKHLLVAMA